MHLGSPLSDLVTGVRGPLLEALVRLERPVTRRTLAQMAGVSPGHASAVIDELVQSGLVRETRAGRASMVSLNRDHLAAKPVMDIVGLRSELLRRLRQRLQSWPDLDAAWLFGSVTRADADRSSDIDVLVVVEDLTRPSLHARLGRLQADVRVWTGNELQVVEHDRSSWRRLVRSGNPLVGALRREAVPLTADADAHLVRRS